MKLRLFKKTQSATVSQPRTPVEKKKLWKEIGSLLLTALLVGGVVWWVIYSYNQPDVERTGDVATEYRDRLTDLESAVTSEPDNATARKEYAVALYATGYLKRAVVQYEAAIKINEKDAGAYASIGNIYRDLEDYKKAVEYYTTSLEHNSVALNTYVNLASVQLYSLDDANAAIETYDKGLKALPDNESLLLLKGIAQEKKGDTDAAKSTYQTLLSKNSENAAAKANLERLQR